MLERIRIIAHEHQFETEVLSADGLWLVAFWADSSGACHLMAPVVEAVSRELKGRMTMVLIDREQASWMATRYRIPSVPAFLFFRSGRLVEMMSGTVSKKILAARAMTLAGMPNEQGR